MKITIIGAGNIGSTLGKKWAGAGHQVSFGVRKPEDVKYGDLRKIGQMKSIEESLEGAEVVLLALPGAAMPDFAKRNGARLAGKIVIDATNDLSSSQMNSLKVLGEFAPDSHLMRAFSTLGWENFASPQIGGVTIDLFYCGYVPSRPIMEELINDIGLRPVYMGDVDNAATIDGLTRLWFALAFGQGRGRRIAIKLLEEQGKDKA